MPNKKLFVVALAALLTLGVASPALADCCDSIWDCAATVVTEGVSCAVQEFIDTVKGLVALVNNLMSEATGATGDATRAAQQSVTQTIDMTTTQSETSDAELAQADASGKKLASEEKQFKVLEAKTMARVPTADVTPSMAPTAPAATTRPVGASKAAQAQAPAPTTGGVTTMRTSVHNPNLAATHPATGGGAPLTATTVAHVGNDVVPVAAPPRSYMAEMDRASAEISKAKAAGDQDMSTIARYMAAARQSEGSGMKSALTIADQAISAPFKNLLSQLTSMLANPTDLTSPSSAVEAMANSIMGNLDKSVTQVIDAITDGPNQAFQAAQPSYTDLQGRAWYAHQIASAMDVLYRERSPGALAALNALLPKVAGAAATGASVRATASVTGHLAFSEVMTNFTASRQKTKVAFLQRFQGFSQRLAQYEAVRVKARTNRNSIATYRTNFSAKLDSYLTGKTPAEVAAQRDSLIAQARVHFANDPKTRDAVINLLTSETNKRAVMIKH
jgi:hypothetical protein